MPKALKVILITVLVLALVGGGVYGGLILYRNSQRTPVNVYAVSDFAMTEYWGDSSEAYGMVTTDKMQNVMISPTQSVTEIFVEEGQEVHAGDPLVAFDTTLSDIDLEKARNGYTRQEANLENARKELENLEKMRPGGMVLITPEPLGIEFVSLPTPQLISGSGTENDPFYVLWGSSNSMTLPYLEHFFSEVPKHDEPEDPEPDIPDPEEPAEPDAGINTVDEPGEGDDEGGEDGGETRDPNVVYVAFVTRDHSALNGRVLNTFGLRLDRNSGETTFRIVSPNLPSEIYEYEEEPQPYYQYYGSPYTKAELEEMRSNKAEEIANMERDLKMAAVELERLEQEVNDGVIHAKMDGIVKVIRDPETAIMEGNALLTVSGGGGYYIEVSMSEMELPYMQLGQTVTVMSWNNGMSYEGTVCDISEYPSTGGDNWTNGNTNVSYYPFTVFVDEDAELTEYDYVSISYTANAGAENCMYLESMFIRTESGKSYVMVQGADGLLEKRTVQTGKNLWGSYTQIRGGLRLDEFVAFPYGNDCVEGAETVQATIDQLYNSVY